MQGCALHNPATPADARSAGRQALLGKLNQCLAEVAAKPHEIFTSSCTNLDITKLRGMTIAQLRTSLGPPGVSSDSYVSVPKDVSAPRPPYECRWAFYSLPENIIGGGPELQCVSEDGRTCNLVRWVMTE